MPSQTFPAWPGAVAAARRYVTDLLDQVPPQTCQTAALLVSELATNAVRHSEAREFAVEVQVLPRGAVWVGVTDDGIGYPTPRTPPVTDEHGRGLQLVGTLADRWGARRRRDTTTKTVWFELGPAPAGAGAQPAGTEEPGTVGPGTVEGA
jgi:anti-sigma regulatory factor (Ser/Thr protein kinase)